MYHFITPYKYYIDIRSLVLVCLLLMCENECVLLMSSLALYLPLCTPLSLRSSKFHIIVDPHKKQMDSCEK